LVGRDVETRGVVQAKKLFNVDFNFGLMLFQETRNGLADALLEHMLLIKFPFSPHELRSCRQGVDQAMIGRM
jgi:hypothetical protein